MVWLDPHVWCFLSGRICALENNLLRRDFFEHLLQEKEDSPEALPLRILACIKESPLREDFLTPEDITDFEEVLQQRFFRHLEEVRDLSPTPCVWELVQTRYDLINLKNFLKEELLGLRRPSPFPSPYTDETWQTVWNTVGSREPCRDRALALSDMDRSCLRQTRLGGPEGLSLRLFLWQVAVGDLKEHLEEVSKDPGLLDLILDSAYLSGLPQLAERTASPFILDYCLEYQKLMGSLFLRRAGKDMLSYIQRPGFPMEKETDWEETVGAVHELPLPRYEKAIEDTLMERLRAARLFVFGPERVFGYLKGLEIETLNLRLAVGGRLRGVPPEDINQRLRKGYV
jgi:hypothetical protein